MRSRSDIDSLIDFIKRGEALGIELPDHLRKKLTHLTHDDGKLKIVLIGGFSEGKTSLVAAWLGQVIEGMKISQSESSDAVKIYDIGDNAELIDTPGLFGFKEKEVSPEKIEKYKDITRQYVSDANLVIDVLNPVNPIKASHEAEIQWLFRDLKLLPRTIFVINRIDDRVDLEDEKAFEAYVKTKKANIIGRLKDLLNLTDQEAHSLVIVAVSANPYEKGAEFWKQRPEEFRKLSHIDALKDETKDILEKIGGREAAKEQTVATLATDIVQGQMQDFVKKSGQAVTAFLHLAEKGKEQKLELDRYIRQAGVAKRSLRGWIADELSDLIVETENTDMSSFREFFHRKIGQDFCVLQARVRTRFEEELGPLQEQLRSMGQAFVEENGDNSTLFKAVGKGASFLSKSNVISASSILSARDAILPTLKFQPWGAVNLARNFNIFLAAIGPILDTVAFWKQEAAKEKFRKARQDIVEGLQKQQTFLLNIVDDPEFITKYFPQIAAIERVFAVIKKDATNAYHYMEKINQWVASGDPIYRKYSIALPENVKEHTAIPYSPHDLGA